MKKGMTLLKLLVGLTVVCAITIIYMMQFSDTRRDARIKTAVTRVYQSGQKIASAAMLYKMKNAKFPTQITPVNDYYILTSSGFLSSAPNTDDIKDIIHSGIGDSSYVNWFSYADSNPMLGCDMNANGRGDLFIILRDVNDPFCQMYNDLYAGGMNMDVPLPAGETQVCKVLGQPVTAKTLKTGCAGPNGRRDMWMHVGGQ